MRRLWSSGTRQTTLIPEVSFVFLWAHSIVQARMRCQALDNEFQQGRTTPEWDLPKAGYFPVALTVLFAARWRYERPIASCRALSHRENESVEENIAFEAFSRDEPPSFIIVYRSRSVSFRLRCTSQQYWPGACPSGYCELAPICSRRRVRARQLAPVRIAAPHLVCQREVYVVYPCPRGSIGCRRTRF